jgi:RNA polymerase sigma-70 factor (ECF subfamily)
MDHYERGRRAWADVPVDRARFLRHVRRHGGDIACVEDLFLAFGCAEGLPTAIAAFEREQLTPLRRFVAWTDKKRAAEVQQRVREYVLVAPRGDKPRIFQYSGRSRLKSWLRVVAVRCLLRLRRRDSAAADHFSGSASKLVKLKSS